MVQIIGVVSKVVPHERYGGTNIFMGPFLNYFFGSGLFAVQKYFWNARVEFKYFESIFMIQTVQIVEFIENFNTIKNQVDRI